MEGKRLGYVLKKERPENSGRSANKKTLTKLFKSHF
jgi:hypothetical protein